MNLHKTFLGLLIISLLISPFSLFKADIAYAQSAQIVEITARPVDPRAQVIKDYLKKHNSPLEQNAQDFIDAADTYSLDWRLVVSIAGTESTFGKFIPGGHDPLHTSYNGWGWGVYGSNVLKFKSWREAIFTISEGLKKNYVDKGLTEPYSMNRIYASSPNWGRNVTFFMNDLEKYSKNYQFDVTLSEIEVMSKMPETRGLKTLLANSTQNFSLDVLN